MDPAANSYLPDFCAGRSVAPIVVDCGSLAIVLVAAFSAAASCRVTLRLPAERAP